MTVSFRQFALAAVFTTILTTSAFADFIVSTDIGGWSSGAVTIGDKTFTLSSFSGLDATDAVTIVGNAAGAYAVNVNGLADNTPGAIQFSYTVQVNDPKYAIASAGINADIQLGAASVSKSYTDNNGNTTNLTSTGSFVSTPLPPTDFLTVNVTTSGGGGTIFSISDGYQQVAIAPEPSSLAMLGMGGFGLAMAIRRRRTSLK